MILKIETPRKQRLAESHHAEKSQVKLTHPHPQPRTLPPKKPPEVHMRQGKAAEALEGGLSHRQVDPKAQISFIPSLFTNSTPICCSQR